jgi:hypothetical protein
MKSSFCAQNMMPLLTVDTLHPLIIVTTPSVIVWTGKTEPFFSCWCITLFTKYLLNKVTFVSFHSACTFLLDIKSLFFADFQLSFFWIFLLGSNFILSLFFRALFQVWFKSGAEERGHFRRGSWLNVIFEILTAAVMKISIFWDVTPCRPLKVNRHFVETFRLHLQCRRISQPRDLCEASSKQRHVPPKRQLTFNGVISQKM